MNSNTDQQASEQPTQQDQNPSENSSGHDQTTQQTAKTSFSSNHNATADSPETNVANSSTSENASVVSEQQQTVASTNPADQHDSPMRDANEEEHTPSNATNDGAASPVAGQSSEQQSSTGTHDGASVVSEQQQTVASTNPADQHDSSMKDLNEDEHTPSNATNDGAASPVAGQSSEQTLSTNDDSSQLKTSAPTTPSDERSDYSAEVYDVSRIPEDQRWLYPKFTKKQGSFGKQYPIMTPDLYHDQITTPATDSDKDKKVIDRIHGSIIGMATGDALGAHVEFRPHSYLVSHPVTDLSSGGTWGLEKGQFTDDTSMALCLATSLIANRGFSSYDQLMRYKWWYRHGYMSSNGQCFDIGNATRESIDEFESRQNAVIENEQELRSLKPIELDLKFFEKHGTNFNCHCSSDGVAGNGALMRLAPVPLFFYRNPRTAVYYSGESGILTHGDPRVRQACEYYGALIVAALIGEEKDEILDNSFLDKHKHWFRDLNFHEDISSIAKGSYKKENGYDDGIRGSGFIVRALEAALWAFWSTKDFRSGALAAVNLGDDTDTTAAIYGQLAGAYYGYADLPEDWKTKIFAKEFLEKLSLWIFSLGKEYEGKSDEDISSSTVNVNTNESMDVDNAEKIQEDEKPDAGDADGPAVEGSVEKTIVQIVDGDNAQGTQVELTVESIAVEIDDTHKTQGDKKPDVCDASGPTVSIDPSATSDRSEDNHAQKDILTDISSVENNADQGQEH